LSRRGFLKVIPVSAVAAAACTQPPYRKEDFAVPAQSPLALLPATSYGGDLADVIGRGLTMLGQDVRGRRVFLKPNMVEYWSDKAVNTDPRVVAGAAEAMLRAGAREVVIGEGPGHRRDVEYLLEGTGMRDVIRDLKLRFVDLNHDDVRRVPLKCRYTEMDAVWLPVEPLDLLDESFLRRIRYKVYAESPTREDFISIFMRCCEERELPCDRQVVEDLIRNELEPRHIQLRGCQPRDLIEHALSLAAYVELPGQLSPELLSAACATYFLGDDTPVDHR